jgi:3-oxoacyl-[acyl-carrier protein] reductase
VRDRGAIINFSSALTHRSIQAYAASAASNAAVEDLTLFLARELRDRDITVNAVAPGPVTSATFGTPASLVEVVAFLAGPGRWLNGQVIYATLRM